MFKTKLLKLYLKKPADDTSVNYSLNSRDSWLNIDLKKNELPKFFTIHLVQIGLILLFSILVFRLAIVQVYTAPIWQDWSSRSTRQIIYTTPPRGKILDRNGEVLVGNTASFTLITTLDNLQTEQQKQEIITSLNIDSADLDKAIKNGISGIIRLKRGLSSNEMLALTEVTNRLGVEIIPDFSRYYIEDTQDQQKRDFFGRSLGSIVGYTSLVQENEVQLLDPNRYKVDSKLGVVGLEKSYENILQGTPGLIERKLVIKNKDELDKLTKESIPGADLKTTLDINIQLGLTQIIDQEFKDKNIKAGSVIVMNAQNGEIRAMVNFPGFDPEVFENRQKQNRLSTYFTDPQRPLFNRSSRGQYPPGSSVKPFVAAVGLEDGIIKPDDQILDEGSIQVKSKVIQGRVDQYINYKSTYYGIINFKQALEKSSDVFFYYLVGGDPETGNIPFSNSNRQVKPLGISYLEEKLSKYFGFGTPTNIDLEYENKGILPDPEYKNQIKMGDWYLGDTYQTAIGQGFFLSTPLQLARATAVIASGGYLVNPHFKLDSNLNQNPKITLSSTTANLVSDAMRSVVTDGTAKRLLNNNSKIAAKTGSAQFDPKNPERIYGWVVSFNQEQAIIKEPLVVVVLTEDIDQTAEYITVPITNLIWQKIEEVYLNRSS